MTAVRSPLQGSSGVFYAGQVEAFGAKVEAYAAQVQGFNAIVDATNHTAPLPNPPPTPPGLTPEQHAAHLAIHELMSVEEFEEERCKPGFVLLSAYWAGNGKRRFCCEAPQKWAAERGGASLNLHHSAHIMNEVWMAAQEMTTPEMTTPERVALPWWRRAWRWVSGLLR